MAKFEWHDNVPIDYGDGVVFYIEDDLDAFNEKFIEVNKKLQAKIQEFHGKDKTSELNAYLDAIDVLLGEDATERLFEKHSLTETNIVSAFLFIAEAVQDFYVNTNKKIKSTGEKISGKRNAPRVEISPEARVAAEDAAKHPPTASGVAIATAKNRQQKPKKKRL
ncbi:MAG: hypothetical protein Q4D42_11085 [Eubacteriales bacterium]|nr:hypothetical protein [Eubacteriales bacterium]